MTAFSAAVLGSLLLAMLVLALKGEPPGPATHGPVAVVLGASDAASWRYPDVSSDPETLTVYLAPSEDEAAGLRVRLAGPDRAMGEPVGAVRSHTLVFSDLRAAVKEIATFSSESPGLRVQVVDLR